MLLDDADSELLKAWVIKRLETVSDADPDVLGDYVLALVSTDDPEPVAKANCNENLKDFLGDSSDTFVDDLFRAIATGSFDPSKPKSKPEPKPNRTTVEPRRSHPKSKKRSYRDWDHDESQNGRVPAFETGERTVKQARRGGRGGSEHYRGRQQQHRPAPYSQLPFPQLPNQIPGLPQFDMNNPVASFIAMQQAMGIFPGFAVNEDSVGAAQKPRCDDFDTKGYCTRGAACPYDHGTDAYVVRDDEYDPTQATILHPQPSRVGTVQTSPASKRRGRGRGRGNGHNFRGGGSRSHFSQVGPNFDRSNTTIVIEQIPEDKVDEEVVRDFFGTFGTIEEVTVRPYKRLAIVKYEDYDSAKAAYDSPKVIFDNRFVKVYWYNPESLSKSQQAKEMGHIAEPQVIDDHIDMEEFAKKQEEAQRKHEEQKRQWEQAQTRKMEVDAQVKAIDAERKTLAEALARKTGQAASPSDTTSVSDHPNETEQTKGLRAQLARLEAEAKSLGIDPNVVANSYDYGAFSRGSRGFRGRYRGRGGYNPSLRDSWAGSGICSVRRLDNRPKTVEVTFTEGSYETHDEEFRQWLLLNGYEAATVQKHTPTDHGNAALVTFPERYLGESFMAAAAGPQFPFSGKVALSWHKTDPTTTIDAQKQRELQTPTATTIQTDAHDVDPQDDASAGREMDDRADDEDRWG